MSADEPMGTMPLLGHLRELRDRLIWSVAALVLGMVLSLAVTQRIIDGLTEMCTVCTFIVIRPTEGIVAYFRVALVLGLILATPMILYQVVSFVLPALHRNERRFLFIMLPGAAAMFALGLMFAYNIVLPRTINFLATFLLESAEPAWSMGNYIAFVTNLLFIIGLTFQTPLIVFMMARLGIVTAATLSRYRRHAVLVIAVLAAVLTPTPDPFTMFMVAAPMYLLYELGIVLARFA